MNHRQKQGCCAAALLISIGGLVALFVTFVGAQNECGDGFNRWTVSQSLVPSTSGYSFTVESGDDITMSFERTSLLKFYLGGRNGFPLTNFTKPSLASLFWPTWDFMCENIAGVMRYNVPNFISRYTISYGNTLWRTNQIVSSSIPGAITVLDGDSATVASFNKRVSGTKSYNVCIKNSLTNCQTEVIIGVVISYCIK